MEKTQAPETAEVAWPRVWDGLTELLEKFVPGQAITVDYYLESTVTTDFCWYQECRFDQRGPLLVVKLKYSHNPMRRIIYTRIAEIKSPLGNWKNPLGPHPNASASRNKKGLPMKHREARERRRKLYEATGLFGIEHEIEGAYVSALLRSFAHYLNFDPRAYYPNARRVTQWPAVALASAIAISFQTLGCAKQHLGNLVLRDRSVVSNYLSNYDAIELNFPEVWQQFVALGEAFKLSMLEQQKAA